MKYKKEQNTFEGFIQRWISKDLNKQRKDSTWKTRQL